jgi:hypothetical protein
MDCDRAPELPVSDPWDAITVDGVARTKDDTLSPPRSKRAPWRYPSPRLCKHPELRVSVPAWGIQMLPVVLQKFGRGGSASTPLNLLAWPH